MTQTIPLGSDARERFLLEIAAVVPPQDLAEVHFFAPMRQGTIETGVAVIAALPETATRHVIYSARYRWTRKGPERGKWESEVVAEADAPLLTVEAVVNGVRQRASEPLEVQKVEGDAVREMIAQAQQRWQTTP